MPRDVLHIARSIALAGLAGGVCLMNSPNGSILISPAAAQEVVSVSVEFHIALEPFGAWHHHARFGEVWVPAYRPAGWRPYTVGHWVYTETYGWYWIEDSDEADWGWITYHYGRWYDDPDEGWVWIAGDDWSPAWTEWREGDDVIGWAPLPPDPVVVELDSRPEYWIFVRVRDFIAPRIDRVCFPVHESAVYVQRTVVVNRTVVVRDDHLAVNPGIPPTHIAAIVGRPLRAHDVRPRVLAGTVNLPGTIQVHAEEWRRQRELALRQGRERFAAPVVGNEPNRTVLRPDRSMPRAQPLAREESGRLGITPPRASQEGWRARPDRIGPHLGTPAPRGVAEPDRRAARAPINAPAPPVRHPVTPPPIASAPHRPIGPPPVAAVHPRPPAIAAAPPPPRIAAPVPHPVAPHIAAPPPPRPAPLAIAARPAPAPPPVAARPAPITSGAAIRGGRPVRRPE